MEIHEKYRIIKPLGSQKIRKFGAVFLVEDKQHGTHAVMKAVNRNKSSELAFQQIIHESRFTFSHHSLPNVLDTFETESEFFLITEHKPGITVDQYWGSLKKKDRIDFLVRFIRQFDELYDELRKKQIVHCDLKPSNILIEGSLNSFQIYLLDFGLALDKDKLQDRKLVFPLGFAAPELLLNELEIADERTDIFALGILIWRLYTDALPLAHPNPSIFTNLQLTHPLPEYDALPTKLYPILRKMCSKHQFKIPPNKMNSSEVQKRLKEGMAKRYSHFRDIISDLEKVKGSKRRWWPFTT